MRYFVSIAGDTHEVVVHHGRVTLDGEPLDAELLPASGGALRVLRLGDTRHRLLPSLTGRHDWTIRVAGARIEAEVVDERTRAIRVMGTSGGATGATADIKAPMPGLVVKVEVAQGQVVTRGQGIVIVEAMKMENELTAETDARVARVRVAPGETVEKGQVLVEFKPLDAAGGPGDE